MRELAIALLRTDEGLDLNCCNLLIIELALTEECMDIILAIDCINDRYYLPDNWQD